MQNLPSGKDFRSTKASVVEAERDGRGLVGARQIPQGLQHRGDDSELQPEVTGEPWEGFKHGKNMTHFAPGYIS